MLTRISRNRASKEYLTVTVTADVTLAAQVVEMATTAGQAQPGEGDWVTAAWVGDAGTTRKAQILVDDAGLTVGPWSVWVRVTDSPEIPVLRAGSLTIN